MAQTFSALTLHLPSVPNATNGTTPQAPPDATETTNVQSPPNVTGLCLSGGGSRALSCALGQLRALRYLGKLDQVFAISSVSGGTWANTLFTYLPASIDDDDFLGEPVTDPGKLALSGGGANDLNYLSPNNMGWVPTGLGLFNDVNTILEFIAEYGLPPSDLWQGLIGHSVLKRYGLWSPDSNGFDKHYFSWTEAYLKAGNGILARNPSLNLGNFRYVQRQRPFPVFNTSIFTNDSDDADLVPFEANFSLGVRNWFPNDGHMLGDIGGGLVESFVMTGDYVGDGDPGYIHSSIPPRPFALNDIAGASSAAFAQIVEEELSKIDRRFDDLVPRYTYWPLRNRQNTPAQTYRFADGGSLENLGLNAMLARGISRLIVCVNTDEKVYRDSGSGDIVVSSDLPPLFGLQPWSSDKGYVPYSHDPGTGANRLFRHNQVFATSDFATLQNALMEAKNGQGSLLVPQTLNVLPNAWFNVPGGYQVQLLWVYNDNVPAWNNLLQPGVYKTIKNDSGKDFPMYDTVLQLELSPLLVNALAQLMFWNLTADNSEGRSSGKTNRQLVEAMFG